MTKPERATRADAAGILALYRAAAKAANQGGHSHWDEGYPNRGTIREDLAGGNLYVWREDGKIVAAITYMHPYGLDGLGISWTPVRRAVEACRFCLAPSQQGKGRAKAYFQGGMELLRAQGVQSMRYLCACDNIAAYKTYTGLGHRQLQDTELDGVAFHSFEALLQPGAAAGGPGDADGPPEGRPWHPEDDGQEADVTAKYFRPTASELRATARKALRGKWLSMALVSLVLALIANAQPSIGGMSTGRRTTDDAYVPVEEVLPEAYDGFAAVTGGPQDVYYISLSADLGPLTRTYTSTWLQQPLSVSHVPEGPDVSHLLAAWEGFFCADPAFWLAGLALALISLVLIPALQLGQYEALHAVFSGKKPTLRQLFSRLCQLPRALWLGICTAFITGSWLAALLRLLLGAMQQMGILSNGAMFALSVTWIALAVYSSVALFRYAMAPYLLWKHPQLRVREALRLSRTRMYGNKAALFRLSLSYIGWYILEAAVLLGAAVPMGMCAVPPAVQTALEWVLLFGCTAFLNSYISAGELAFYRALEVLQASE